MNENDLKRYTVILGGGSGVLFQPLDETVTYILSAKHVFYKKQTNDRGADQECLLSSIDYFFSDKQGDSIPFEIKKGENYFEHKDADAAILVLEKNLSVGQIFIEENCDAFNEYLLCGYPSKIDGNKNDRYSNHQINRKIDTTNNGYLRLETNFGNLNYEDIKGFSGGGVLRLCNGVVNIIGIQSSTTTHYANGQIDIVPIKCFIEIIAINKLSPIDIDDFSNINGDWKLHDSVFSVTVNSASKKYYLRRNIDETFLNYLKRNKNVWISGISGIGKTFLAVGNIYKIIEKPIRIDLTCSSLDHIDNYFEYINHEIIRQCNLDCKSSKASIYDRISDNLCEINLQSSQILIFVDEVPILDMKRFYDFLTGFVNISERYANLREGDKNINWIISTRINPAEHLNNDEWCLPNTQKAKKNFHFKNLDLWSDEEISKLLKILQISLNFKLSKATESKIIEISKGLPGVSKSVIERLLIENCSIDEAIEIIKSENI